MQNKVTSVFDIVGKIPITPSPQHIDSVFNLGKMLRSLMPTPIIKTVFDLDAGIRQSSLTVELQTALVAGLAGISSLSEDKNIYDYAYQEGIAVSFVPNSRDLVHPDTTLVTVATAAYQFTLELTVSRKLDALLLTAINDHVLRLDLASSTRLWVLTPQPAQVRHYAATAQLAIRVESGQNLTDEMSLMVIAAENPVAACETLRTIVSVAGAAIYRASKA